MSANRGLALLAWDGLPILARMGAEIRLDPRGEIRGSPISFDSHFSKTVAARWPGPPLGAESIR